MSTSMGAALVNEIDRLHDELDRMRMMFLECWVCNCALAAPTRHWIPPHCSDCIVTEEVTQLWEEWFSKHGAKK